MQVAKAHERTSSISANGQKPHNLLQQKAQRSTWERIKDILPHREDLVVAGREVKGGIVIHPIIASALLTAILAAAGLIYRNISTELAWQHDQLNTLAVQKADQEKFEQAKAEELSKRLQNIEATQIALGRDLVRAQEAMKAKGRN